MNDIPYISNKKLHIFIADDDGDDIDIFTEAIKEMPKSIKLSIARDGQELLEFLDYVTPDLIFLDINMPCMNGIDCLTEIRKMKKLDLVPVIIYSTTNNKAEVEQTYALGANLYILKPGSFESIKRQVKKVLSLNINDLIPQVPREKFMV